MEDTTKPIKVFYAEDSLHDRQLFKLSLSDINVPVSLVMAEDGEKAMKALTSSTDYKPDLILLDLKMPRLDGLECLAEIRKDAKFNDTPVIMYSTSVLEKDVKNAYALGANLYIEKPLDVDTQIRVFYKIFSLKPADLFPQLPIDKFILKD